MKAQILVQVAVFGGLAYLACVGDARSEEPRASKLERKLCSIVIPEVNLREANLSDVVAFLVETSRKLDPEKQGVNIVIAPGATTAGTTAGADPFTGKTNAPPAEPRITLNLRNMSEMEVLKIVMELAGLKARARGNFILLVPLNTPDSELVTRTYSVLPTFSEKIKAMAE